MEANRECTKGMNKRSSSSIQGGPLCLSPIWDAEGMDPIILVAPHLPANPIVESHPHHSFCSLPDWRRRSNRKVTRAAVGQGPLKA